MEKNWRSQAACAGIEDPDIFFPPRSKHLYTKIADEAKRVCTGNHNTIRCPVRNECLMYAIERDEQHGIWGGMSHRERNVLIRKAKKENKTVEEMVYNGEI